MTRRSRTQKFDQPSLAATPSSSSKPPSPAEGKPKLKRGKAKKKGAEYGLKLADAARIYGYHRVYLQQLLIEGRLDGWKEPPDRKDFNRGHWFVAMDAMDALAAQRRRPSPSTVIDAPVAGSLLALGPTSTSSSD